jgi:hypothetical protein
MPLELQIIRASEFVRLGAHGHFDLAASKAALAVLVGACRKRGINQALMDLRQLRPGPKPVYSRADLIELVNTFREIGFTQNQRLAILYHSDPHHRARLFAFLSKLHGWTVQAFGDFEEALRWLSSGEETIAQPVRSATGKKIRARASRKEEKPETLPLILPGRRQKPVPAIRSAGSPPVRPADPGRQRREA